MRKLWAFGGAYLVFFFAGLLGLMWLTRAAAGWATVSLASAFPVVLVAVAALLSRHEARTVARPEPRTSILDRPIIGHIRLAPPRWTTTAALSMVSCTAYYVWVFPAEAGSIRLMFVAWCWAIAAFTGLVLPRLLRGTTFSPSA